MNQDTLGIDIFILFLYITLYSPLFLGNLVLKHVDFVIFFLGVSMYAYSLAGWVGDSIVVLYFFFFKILSSPRGVKKNITLPLFSTKSKYHVMAFTGAKKKFGFVGYFMIRVLIQLLCIVITKFSFKLPTLRSFMDALNTLRLFATWHVTIFNTTSLHCHLLLALCRLLTCSWKYIILNFFDF